MTLRNGGWACGRSAWRAALAGACMLASWVRVAAADDAAIVAALAQVLEATDAATRSRLADQIQADPEFDRARLGAWLHAAVRFAPLGSGIRELAVPQSGGPPRRVVLRVPRDYDARRAWPVIYALHGQGGHAEQISVYLERLLGAQAEQYVIAAPQDYEQVAIQGVAAPGPEHLENLAAVRAAVHVDSDRVYVTGYSRGGHAAWTLAVLHADQFAAAVPLAGSLILPDGDAFFDVFLPNVAHLPVWQVWGANDVYLDDGATRSPQGGIAEVNRSLRRAAERLALPIESYEDPAAGHTDVRPPRLKLREMLARRRVSYPAKVEHHYRELYQGRAYWLEATQWAGERWEAGELKTNAREGEDAQAALHRAIRNRLGELRGSVLDNQIDVRRQRVGELVVWLGDGLIDWGRPVELKVSGKVVFRGVLEPDLRVCLAEVVRTRDFERLRWAGLRVKGGEPARQIRGED